jgi:hypothetical protein
MEPRLIIAYVLLAILAGAVIASIAYVRYNSRDRKVARRRGREDVARTKRLQEH